MAAFEIVDQVIERNPRAAKTRRSIHDIGIAKDNRLDHDLPLQRLCQRVGWGFRGAVAAFLLLAVFAGLTHEARRSFRDRDFGPAWAKPKVWALCGQVVGVKVNAGRPGRSDVSDYWPTGGVMRTSPECSPRSVPTEIWRTPGVKVRD